MSRTKLAPMARAMTTMTFRSGGKNVPPRAVALKMERKGCSFFAPLAEPLSFVAEKENGRG
jgi:hypothetical protein